MDEWRKRRCWWRKIIRGGGGGEIGNSCVVILMTVNHTHMHVVLAVFIIIQVTGMLIAIVKIFNSNVWQYIIRRLKASRRMWWRR